MDPTWVVLKTHFQQLKESATGGDLKSSLAIYWRRMGYNEDFVRHQDGSYVGNQGRFKYLQVAINKFEESQRVRRCNLTNSAYQESPEDVRKVFFTLVETNRARAIRLDMSIDYKQLQVAIINIMKSSSVSRGSEMIYLQTRYLLLTV